MLLHMPAEARRKCLLKMKQHCFMCLNLTTKCSCDELWTKDFMTGKNHRECPRCKKSIFMCDHPEAEEKINAKRRFYNALFLEVKNHGDIPKNVVVPQLAKKTQSVYALQAMAETESKPFHTQLSDIIPGNCQEDLNNLCAVSGLDRRDIARPSKAYFDKLYKLKQVKRKPKGKGLLELFQILGKDGRALLACSNSGCTGNLHTDNLVRQDSLHNTQVSTQLTNSPTSCFSLTAQIIKTNSRSVCLPA